MTPDPVKPQPFTTDRPILLAELPLREDLRGAVPYGAPQLDVAIRLNTNENPYPPTSEVIAAIAQAVSRAAGELNRYPDREAWSLRESLARYLSTDTGTDLTAHQIWAANGSNEVITQLLQAFGGPGRTALSFDPTYSMYPEYARNTHTRWVAGSRRPDFTIDVAAAERDIARHRPSVVLLTSPNNPTGTAIDLGTLQRLTVAARDVDAIVIVDEAYAEFRRPGVPSAVSLLASLGNLVVTRTMSKAFALAGGRVGYLAAATAVVDAVRIVRLPYHLSSVSQAVATAALAHSGQLLARVAELRAERDACVGWLRSCDLEVADSDANFVLFGCFTDRHQVWQGLLDRGVLIRETGPDGWLRVSIGTSAEMAGFRQALLSVLGAATGGDEQSPTISRIRQDDRTDQ